MSTDPTTDLTAAYTAINNTYVHEGIAADAFQDARNKLALAVPDVAGAAQSLAVAETHVSYMAFQSAEAETAIKVAEADVAVVPPIVVPPPVTTPPPAVVPGKVLKGWWVNAADGPPLAPDVAFDFADNNAQSYTFSTKRVAALAGGKQLWLKCAPKDVPTALALGKVLIAGAQAHAGVILFWENNQDVWESWNEKTYTAAQMAALFNEIADALMSVAGAQFTIGWCPNVAQEGNQGSGRTQLDTAPGPRANLVCVPDGYDYPQGQGSVAANLAEWEKFYDFCVANGYRWGGCAEWGLHAWDDDAYITGFLAWLKSKNSLIELYFSGTTAEGASFDSELSKYPKSLAAYKATA